jgi:hypothetical protein
MGGIYRFLHHFARVDCCFCGLQPWKFHDVADVAGNHYIPDYCGCCGCSRFKNQKEIPEKETAVGCSIPKNGSQHKSQLF